jgi:hypothetical protein
MQKTSGSDDMSGVPGIRVQVRNWGREPAMSSATMWAGIVGVSGLWPLQVVDDVSRYGDSIPIVAMQRLKVTFLEIAKCRIRGIASIRYNFFLDSIDLLAEVFDEWLQHLDSGIIHVVPFRFECYA